MQPEGRLIDTIELKNGMTVYFYDQSRSVVGDRWQVKLLAKIPLEIKPDHFDEFDDNPDEICKGFISVVGKTISFQSERLRNFIDHSEVPQTLAELKDEFLRSNLDYISRPHFARKFILKKYQEHRENERLGQLYRQHLQQPK